MAQRAVMVSVEQHTSGVGVAATRTEKAAMTDKFKAVNRMFAILTLSFIHAGFYPLSTHALIAHYPLQIHLHELLQARIAFGM